jgi:cysteinyl-tRNA synthetase
MSVEMVLDFLDRRWAYEAPSGAIMFDAKRAPPDVYVAFWRSFEPIRVDPGTRDFALWAPNDRGEETPWGKGVFTENGINMHAIYAM